MSNTAPASSGGGSGAKKGWLDRPRAAASGLRPRGARATAKGSRLDDLRRAAPRPAARDAFRRHAENAPR